MPICLLPGFFWGNRLRRKAEGPRRYRPTGKPPTAPEDPRPDGKYTVTGLLTYREAETYAYAQEMVVTAGAERKIIRQGDPGVVDSGTLLAVHPLGGIVKMPSGHYYLYPLGKSFTDRVLLQAESDTELASAIDAWTRR